MRTYTRFRKLERFVLILVLLSWAPVATAQTREPSMGNSERERETVNIPAGSTQVYVAPVAGRGVKGVRFALRF